MLCDQCKTRQANIHLENNVNGKVQKRSLCSQCAQEMGLGGGHPLFTQLFGQGLFKLGSQVAPLWSEPQPYEVCQSCGTGYQDFQKGGLFGCPDCYEAFGPKLSSIFKRVQAGESHVGRRLAESLGLKTLTDVHEIPVQQEVLIEEGPKNIEEQVKELKAEQDAAVAREDYEKAAAIRDRIKALQADRERENKEKQSIPQDSRQEKKEG